MKESKIAFALLISFILVAALPPSLGVTSVQTNEYIEQTSIELAFNPGEFEFSDVNTEEGMFATVSLPDVGFDYIEGQAKLPIIRKFVEIPQESNPEIIIDSISWDYISLAELNLPDRIIPAQFSVEKIPQPNDDFVIDDEYYSTNEFLPENIAQIAEIGTIRGRRFALVELSPIQYNPATGELKIMNSCEITIGLPNSNMEQTYEKIERYFSPSYEKIFEKMFVNYGDYEIELEGRDQECLLIIVYDSFYEEIQPLVSLKETLDYDVVVTKTSDIPGGATKEKITDYIEDAYDTWSNPPVYVLLVGDTPQIPTYTGTTYGPSAVDLYFVTVDGTDYIPDIHIGRFPGSQESHIEAMVEKTVYYEEGDFENISWIKKAAFLASMDNYLISEGTHNYVIDNFLNPNGYTCDKLYTVTYSATTQQVHDAINDGRSLVIFSGHGSPSGWGDGPPFYQSDVQALMNENMYPFVCSHSCLTNTFDNSECFGETWLREADKGGLAFWGASASTYWDEDDILEKGMFQAWWEDGLDWIGGMTDMGLLYLYENYSGGGYTKYYFEAYNVNGDPSVRIWSDEPNPSLPPEPPQQPNGPIEGCVQDELTYSTSTTDPEEDQIYYQFDWGNGEFSDWLGPYNSGVTIETSYIWNMVGIYEVCVKAKDINNKQSDWSEALTVTIGENQPPVEVTIQGKQFGFGGIEYEFTFVSTDPDGHDIFYRINWDDGEDTGWLGPYSSGEQIALSHSWDLKGDYWVKAWAKDTLEDSSNQASFKINILTNRAKTAPAYRDFLFLRILENFINRFPFIEDLLQNIIQ